MQCTFLLGKSIKTISPIFCGSKQWTQSLSSERLTAKRSSPFGEQQRAVVSRNSFTDLDVSGAVEMSRINLQYSFTTCGASGLAMLLIVLKRWMTPR